MKNSLWWPLIIIVAGCAMGLLIVTDLHSPLRVALTFAFFLICPGMAFVRLLGLNEWLTELTLAVALSFALNTLLSEALVFAEIWSPQLGGMVLIALTLIGALIQLSRALHSPERPYGSSNGA